MDGLLDPAAVAIWSAFILALVLLLRRSYSISLELYVLLIVAIVAVLIGLNYVMNTE